MGLRKDVLVSLGMDSKEYDRKMDAANRKLKKTTSDLRKEGRRLSITSRELFLGLTVPLGFVANSVTQATAEFEKLNKGLETIARSRGITNIKELSASVKNLAKLPGLGLRESFQAMAQLLGTGINQTASLGIIQGFGTGIARASKGAAEFQRVMTQVVQAISLGKITAQDFKTIFSEIPEARPIVERIFGTSDLEGLRQKGVGVKQVVASIALEFLKLGSGGLGDSLNNKLENIRDTFFDLKATAGNTVFKDVIHNTLDSMDSVMKKMIGTMNNLNPAWGEFITRLTVATTKIAIVVPIAGLIVKNMLLMKAAVLQNSKIFQFLSTTATLVSGSLLKLRSAQVLQRYASIHGTSAAITFRLALLSIGTAARTAGKFIRRAIPIIGELYIAWEIFGAVFPKQQKAVWEWATSLIKAMKAVNKEQARTLFSGGVSSINPGGVSAPKGTQGAGSLGLGIFGGGPVRVPGAHPAISGETLAYMEQVKALQQLLDSMNDSARDTGKAGKQMQLNFLDPFTSFLVNVGREISDGKIKAALDTIKEIATGSGIAPRIQTGDKRSGVFGKDGTGVHTQKLGSNRTDSTWGITADIALQSAVLAENVERIFATASNNSEALEAFKENMNQMFGGALADGIDAVANAFGNLAEDGLAGTHDAFENFKKNIGAAIKQIIGHLIKLIAKLAITAALMEIVFPGQKIGDLMTGGGAFGKGGALEGKGKFLKLLFGGLGFSEGGIVPGVGSHDSVPAMLTPGEMVLTKDQQKALGSRAAKISINGMFTARGRDLVYVLESNQIQLNSNR